MWFYRSNPGKLVIAAITFSSLAVAIPAFQWYVFASSSRTGFAWVACAYILPDKAGLPCIAAALFVGINVVIRAHGHGGYRTAILPTRDSADPADDGLLRMYHHVGNETYDFINTTALTHEWHNVSVPDSEMDVIVRRLPGGRIHARTQGFSQMGCQDGQCPAESDVVPRSSRLFRRSAYRIQEIEFAWSEDPGFGKATQAGVKDAALVAADVVVKSKAGNHRYCSSAYSSGGGHAKVGFNFYSSHYGADYPQPCM